MLDLIFLNEATVDKYRNDFIKNINCQQDENPI